MTQVFVPNEVNQNLPNFLSRQKPAQKPQNPGGVRRKVAENMATDEEISSDLCLSVAQVVVWHQQVVVGLATDDWEAAEPAAKLPRRSDPRPDYEQSAWADMLRDPTCRIPGTRMGDLFRRRFCVLYPVFEQYVRSTWFHRRHGKRRLHTRPLGSTCRLETCAFVSG